MPDWVEIGKKTEELLTNILLDGEVVLFKETCSCQTEEDFNDGLLVLTNHNIIFIRRDSFEPRYEVGLRSPLENINYITYLGTFYQTIEVEVNIDGCPKTLNFMDFSTQRDGTRKISEIHDELKRVVENYQKK
ncbi:MAG: hypothetical protein QXO71_07690 [Candidatus Jordarchaeaceae archaeon]